MKLTLGWLAVLLATWIDIGDITKINKAKEEAAKAFKDGFFQVAANKYKYLVEELKVKEDAVLLNYAHACYMVKDTATAITNYNALLRSPDRDIRSVSSQQLGVIRAMSKNLEQALKHFKQALRDQPENHEARTNYELIKKLLEKQRQQQQQQQQSQQNQQNQQNQQKQDQQKKDQPNQDQQQKQDGKDQKAEEKQAEKNQQKDGQKQEAKEEDAKEEKNSQEKKEAMEKRSQRLQKMNMTEEQAKMILDAMKNNEAQYLQQLQRKTTKRPDKGKPDW
jgi:Ca-activated chloride channel homolog